MAASFSLASEMTAPGINPEHLLLALLLQQGSVGNDILRKTPLDLEDIRHMLTQAARSVIEVPEEERDRILPPRLSPHAKRAIEKAVLTANVHDHKYIGTEHLLSGLLQIESPIVDAILTDQGVDIPELKQEVETVLKSTSRFPEITETFEVGQAPPERLQAEELLEESMPQQDNRTKTPALDFFATDLTDPKLQKDIDPVIGREEEISRLTQILCRRTKNNPVLLGDPGVGKTAIIEGLAKRIMQGDVPEVLAGKRIMSLDLSLILAGTIYRGEFEGRLKQIVDEVKNDPDIILFVDELHNIMGAGSTSGSLDAANILKPALARGTMRCIGATTLSEYKKHIENDGALDRRFQPISVDPPSPETAVRIIRGLRGNYENYHGVTITDEAIEAAVSLSERFITDRFLPDKAIDLIDEAAASVRVAHGNDEESRQTRKLEDRLAKIRRKKQRAVTSENFIDALELKTKEQDLLQQLEQLKRGPKKDARPKVGSIGREDIAVVVSRATGVPVTDLLMQERDRLLRLENLLKERIVGQQKAVADVAELIRRAKAGIADPGRPLASFLFLGPSGVGKTELAKVLAETVFQDKDALIRIDMSEFAEGFNISKLIGAPAGYVGYRDDTKLTDTVKRKPHSIVLFDEIEKAHGEVHNLLLQILEDGHITDATGRQINFKNTIVVMTSNVGAAALKGGSIGFMTAEGGDLTAGERQEAQAEVLRELEQTFRPEFLNRIDKIVTFEPLSRKDILAITKLQMGDLTRRLEKEHGIGLRISPAVIKTVAEKSWNPLYGARTVRRQIQELVENPLATELLSDNCRTGDTVSIAAKGGRITIAKRRTHARNQA
ncbi:hypothetical protein AMJ57_02800 [Parcubacteria bacterium SG8_24]|nr:MAG: hypothetical protein AMJ57_02800 [Parcubacteria bacterium SG8_24]